MASVRSSSLLVSLSLDSTHLMIRGALTFGLSTRRIYAKVAPFTLVQSAWTVKTHPSALSARADTSSPLRMTQLAASSPRLKFAAGLAKYNMASSVRSVTSSSAPC